MSEIKRYDNVNGGSIACHECYMDESSDGDYVRHADHVVYLNEVKLELSAAQSELAALREELEAVKANGPALVQNIGRRNRRDDGGC